MGDKHCQWPKVEGRLSLPSVLRAALLFLLVAGSGSLASGQDEEDDSQLGREAFAKKAYPWYDHQKDEARPLRIGKKSDTTASSQKPAPRSSSSPTSTGSGISLFGSLIQVVGLILLALVLVAVAALIAWAFLRNETTQSAAARVVSASREVDRIEQLPVSLKRASSDFLAEARRLAEGRNYSEAIIYLYSHLLVQLDKHHVIRLTKGKTNRQYVRESRARPALAGILELTMVAFEDVYFGHHELERERFEECLRLVPAFDADLTQLERAAA